MAPPSKPIPATGTQPVSGTSPWRVTQQMQVSSPHSPTMLRYPPNPNYKEWWGRCFRCTRKGHIVPECRYPRWHPNHLHGVPSEAAVTTKEGNSASPPVVPHTGRSQPPHRIREEPSFEEFLAEPEPQREPEMPPNRPLRAQCYFNRDKKYFQDLDRMLSGLVVQPPEHLLASISLDQIAATVASSGKVLVEHLQVASISRDKFIVLLPATMIREEVVAAMPRSVWDQGFKLHSYSPLFDTTIAIPLFKLWIDIEGAPLELSQESHMARAISSFGCYLGSLEPKTHGDCRSWSIFMATDDLTLVPHQLDFKIGGLVYTANIHPRKWVQGQVYKPSDLPPPPTTFHPTPPQFITPLLAGKEPSEPNPLWFQGDDVMHMSLKAMREIFRNFDSSDLPPDLAECLAGNPAAIKAHKDAGRAWELQVARQGKARMGTDTSRVSHDATGDLPQQAAISNPSQQPRPAAVRPSSPLSLAVADVTSPTVPTVHRTEQRASRGKRTQADLALQVCTTQLFVNLGEDVHPWEPHDLFPEISTPLSRHITQPEPIENRVVNQCPPPKVLSPSRRPRRTGSRIGTKKNAEGTVLDIDMQAFVDVPLKDAEGTEILALIGAGHIPIPSHIILPSQMSKGDADLGQPNRVQTKRKKQTGISPKAAVTIEGSSAGPMEPLDLSPDAGPVDKTMHLLGNAGPVDSAIDLEEQGGEDQEDDPYIDRVDYSDEDPLY